MKDKKQNIVEDECVSVVEWDCVSEQQSSLIKSEALKKWEREYDEGIKRLQKKYANALTKETRENVDEERKEYKSQMAVKKTDSPEDDLDTAKKKKGLLQWVRRLRLGLKEDLKGYGVARSSSVVLVPKDNIKNAQRVIEDYKRDYEKLFNHAKKDGFPFRTNSAHGFSKEVIHPAEMMDIEMHRYHPEETDILREKAADMGVKQLNKLIDFLDEHNNKLQASHNQEKQKRHSADRIRTELDNIIDILRKFKVAERKEVSEKIDEVDRKFAVYRDLIEA